MSESLAVGHPATRPASRATASRATADAVGLAALDWRRKLQLALGGIWVLDGILQYQPSMFTKSFPGMLAESAHGNPAVMAGPITWSADLIDHHVVVLNAIFATVQLALGLGIAWRPTVRLALAASIAWSLAVWWLGEGFGGILAGTASPVNGAPGPVVLYAILAVLLWPADRDPDAPSVAGRFIGRRSAQAVWLVLWGSLAAFALLPASRAPGTISDLLSGGADGAPAWLAWIDTRAASALNGHGLAASIVLAVLLALVAAAAFLPVPVLRAAVVLAIALAAALWLAQGMGELFTGMATDPESGPLLALLALSFWPAVPVKLAVPVKPAVPAREA
jgi:hypothetical protein